jgi:hypothetical protein
VADCGAERVRRAHVHGRAHRARRAAAVRGLRGARPADRRQGCARNLPGLRDRSGDPQPRHRRWSAFGRYAAGRASDLCRRAAAAHGQRGPVRSLRSAEPSHRFRLRRARLADCDASSLPRSPTLRVSSKAPGARLRAAARTRIRPKSMRARSRSILRESARTS